MAISFGRGFEFIHGNRDGSGKASDTYTICRVKVPRRRLAAEIKQGLHPKYRLTRVKGCYYPEASAHSPAIVHINTPLGGWRCPAQSIKQLPVAGRPRKLVDSAQKGARIVEFIHGDTVPAKPSNRTYTICRFGVSRRRVVEEITAGLHPGYCIVRRPTGFYPSPTNAQAIENWRCCMVSVTS